MSLKGEVAIITGASSGIGRGVARDLDQAGMKLVLSGRRTDRIQHLARLLTDAVAVAGHLTDDTTPRDLVDIAVSRFGRLDVVFNYAGIMVLPSEQAM